MTASKDQQHHEAARLADILRHRGYVPLAACREELDGWPQAVRLLEQEGLARLVEHQPTAITSKGVSHRYWVPDWVEVTCRLTGALKLGWLTTLASDPVHQRATLAAYALGGEQATLDYLEAISSTGWA